MYFLGNSKYNSSMSSLHSKQLGNIGELSVAADLAKKGYSIFKELGDYSKIDLIAEKDNKLVKVQVKSSSYEDRETILLPLKKRGPNGYTHVYSVEEVDIFALYIRDTGEIIYIASSEALSTSSTFVTFRKSIPLNNQSSKVRMVENYLDFEKAIRSLN